MANDFFTVHELESSNFNVMNFEGKWRDTFGLPARRGIWIIYGESSNGKTTFIMQVAKYLTEFVKHKVLINSLEEGKSESLKLACQRANLSTVAKKIQFGNRQPIESVRNRLRKQRSPEIIFIDSLQYTDLDKEQYKDLREEHKDKLWIFNSHGINRRPKGSLAEYILFDADVKIRVEGFKAFVNSRFGGGEPYIINAKRAAKYHGEIQ